MSRGWVRRRLRAGEAFKGVSSRAREIPWDEAICRFLGTTVVPLLGSVAPAGFGATRGAACVAIALC